MFDYWCKTCGKRFYSCSEEQYQHDVNTNDHEVCDDMDLDDRAAPILYITEGK